MTNEEIIESLEELIAWYDAARHDYYGCANVRMDKTDREACVSAIKILEEKKGEHNEQIRNTQTRTRSDISDALSQF